MSQLEKLEQVAVSLHCEVRHQESMRNHTTFKIGGPADLFVVVNRLETLKIVCQTAQALAVPYLIIGKGSNLLVKDSGIRGAVIQLGGSFRNMHLKDNSVLQAGAGASLASVCGYALQQSLSGLEFAWGVPGSVGGAVFMNAGAYGEEMKDVIVSCTHMRPDGEIETLQTNQLQFAYRRSIYQNTNLIVLSVDFQLHLAGKRFIKEKMDDLFGRRKDKQPLDFPSAGSVFKRPTGHFAGTLIEQCGLKGAAVGGAMVSLKHAGFIVNTGNATCRDVLALIAFIQTTVKERTGVALECEIRPIGGDL